jgi:hypothetical protein
MTHQTKENRTEKTLANFLLSCLKTGAAPFSAQPRIPTLGRDRDNKKVQS